MRSQWSFTMVIENPEEAFIALRKVSIQLRRAHLDTKAKASTWSYSPDGPCRLLVKINDARSDEIGDLAKWIEHHFGGSR